MINKGELLKYYSRRDIQTALVEAAKDREVSVKYGDSGFGKRPDVLVYPNDVLDFVKQGATSFHISEERWQDPMLLKTGMYRKELDEIRKGFECVLDIDTKFFEYSRMTAKLLLEAIKFHNVNSCGVKFSGNKGFHLSIPFEAFPNKINDVDTCLLFPETPRFIAEYLKEFIRKNLRDEILRVSTLQEIARAANIEREKLIKDGVFDPFTIVDVDTVLISSRHMFRAPYSINEKSGLVSVPLSEDQLKTFKLGDAKIENVKTDVPFVKIPEEQEAATLVMQAFDFCKKLEKKDVNKVQEYANKGVKLDKKISEEFFPPCVKLILKGLGEDGRKRAVFMLINFLRSTGHTLEEVETILKEWNKKNYEPLREGYLLAQISWAKRQARILMPPNCESEMYMKGIGVCKPDGFCSKIKNPAQYALFKDKIFARQKKKPQKKKLTTSSKALKS